MTCLGIDNMLIGRYIAGSLTVLLDRPTPINK